MNNRRTIDSILSEREFGHEACRTKNDLWELHVCKMASECVPWSFGLDTSSESSVTCPRGAIPTQTVAAVQHYVTLCPQLKKRTNSCLKSHTVHVVLTLTVFLVRVAVLYIRLLPVCLYFGKWSIFICWFSSLSASIVMGFLFLLQATPPLGLTLNTYHVIALHP